ncbi:cuticle protein 3 [Dendroctonus ponderosae]|nr:cuticle protein 3 [Dendroctonus ponderosae]
MEFYSLMAISLCLSVVRAFPQRQERGFSNSAYYQPAQVSQIPILSMDVKNDGEAYQFAFETGNKIAQQEAGDGVRTQGSYAYVAPDGQKVSMSYVADAEGFRPQGSHMPVAPPMPEAIRKAVEQNLADEARGIVDDGQYHENPKTLPAPALPPKYRV